MRTSRACQQHSTGIVDASMLEYSSAANVQVSNSYNLCSAIEIASCDRIHLNEDRHQEETVPEAVECHGRPRRVYSCCQVKQKTVLVTVTGVETKRC